MLAARLKSCPDTNLCMIRIFWCESSHANFFKYGSSNTDLLMPALRDSVARFARWTAETAVPTYDLLSAYPHTSFSMLSQHQLLDELLQCGLLFNPGVVIVLGLHFEVRLHVVMPEAAQLGADDVVFANFRRGEMNRDIQAGDEILLNA